MVKEYVDTGLGQFVVAGHGLTRPRKLEDFLRRFATD